MTVGGSWDINGTMGSGRRTKKRRIGVVTGTRAEYGIYRPVMEAITKQFTPEFRNRLDAIIQFQPLSFESLEKVVNKFLFELEAQLAEKQVSLTVDEIARQWLAENGYDPKMGARPMARLIQEKIKKPLAEELLFGELVQGGHVHITLEDGEFNFAIEVGEAV